MNSKVRRLATLAAQAAALLALLLCSAVTAHADASNGNPDVSFSRGISNLGPFLIVHVRSHTQDPANCLYAADAGIRVTRNFFLPGFGTQDVRIDPAIPLLRLWNINVSCTNGKSTQLTYWY
jgi:hypothetical protein